MSDNIHLFLKKQFNNLYQDRVLPLIQSEHVPDAIKRELTMSFHSTNFLTKKVPELKKKFMALSKLCSRADAIILKGVDYERRAKSAN